jgi:hypothetical protein
MNRIARTSTRRIAGAARMKRVPACNAASGRSLGRVWSVLGRCHSASTATIPPKDTALSANTRVGPDTDTSTPATAGPTARPRLMFILPSAAAEVICSRGTNSGWIACHAGAVRACPHPKRNSNVSSTAGVVCPVAVDTASTPASTAIVDCAPSSSLRRSSRSASTPDGMDSNITGSVIAVCTNETSVAAFGSSTKIHCAPTVCIQVPKFDTNCAIHNAR